MIYNLVESEGITTWSGETIINRKLDGDLVHIIQTVPDIEKDKSGYNVPDAVVANVWGTNASFHEYSKFLHSPYRNFVTSLPKDVDDLQTMKAID